MSKIFAYIPSAYSIGKTYTAIPNDGTADFNFTRPATATRTNPNGDNEVMAIDVPRIDYSDGGCPTLLLFTALDEKCFNATPLSIDPSNIVWNVELAATGDTGVIRTISLTDLTNSYVTIGFTDVAGQTSIKVINNGLLETEIKHENSNITELNNISVLRGDNKVSLKINGVTMGTVYTINTMPTMTEMSYSLAGASEFMDGKTRNTTIDDDLSTFLPGVSSTAEIKAYLQPFYTIYE